jgi:hypothetical protein
VHSVGSETEACVGWERVSCGESEGGRCYTRVRY